MWIKVAPWQFETGIIRGGGSNDYALLNVDTGDVILIRGYNEGSKKSAEFYTVELVPSFKFPTSIDFVSYKDKKWCEIDTDAGPWIENNVCFKAFDTLEQAQKYLDKLAEKLGAEVIDIDET